MLATALKASADLAQSTGDDVTTGSSMYAVTDDARRTDVATSQSPLPAAAGSATCRVDPLNRTESALAAKLTFADAPVPPYS